VTDEPITELKISIARLETEFKNLALEVRAMPDRFEGMIPRHEVEREITVLTGRIKALESNQTWLVRAVIGAWVSGVGFVAFAKKLFG
jgi:hypothetical protein